MGRFDDYISYFHQYQKIYGSKTTVLYQCGMFFEIYGIDNEQEKLGHAGEISQLLNIQLTRTRKEIIENNRKNPLMTGFPCNNLQNHLQIMINHGYTVVVVEQVGQTKVGSKIVQKREVTGIYSPGTYTGNIAQTENYLVSIYVDGQKSQCNIGLSAIDLSTGQSYLHFSLSDMKDRYISIDETCRFIQSLQPRELIIIGDSKAITDYIDDQLLIHILDKKPNFSKNSFQNQFLKNYYADTGMLTAVEYLDLEFRHTTATSFCYLLDFCQSHDPKLLKKLKKPEIWDNDATLILDNNAINQLNLLPLPNLRKKNGSVLEIITATSTNMGKRLLKSRLINPVLNPELLEQRYNYIDLMLSTVDTNVNIDSLKITDKRWYVLLENYLREIIDIEKFQRKIQTETLQPTEFVTLVNSYEIIGKIIEIINDSGFKDLVNTEVSAKFEKFMKDLAIVDRKKAAKFNLNDIADNIFLPGFYQEIDDLAQDININKEYLTVLAAKFTEFVNTKNYEVSVKDSDDGHYLNVTKTKFKLVEKRFKPFTFGDNFKVSSLKDFSYDNRTKTNTKIRGGIIDDLSKKIKQNTFKLQHQIREKYLEFLSILTDKYDLLFQGLVILTAELDLYKSSAKTALKNNYSRPIINADSSRSNFKVTNLRHPIIEKLETHQQYIPHSFELDSQGMLLYGINASGKSSIMKAIGVAVILAQAGFFVPCEQLDLGIYQKIMTRILGNDNIFKGLSSFAVEMTELRGILNRADQNSLILGDEICHGTETSSAISIVVAAIQHLSDVNASFIFATHLHQITHMTEILSIKNLLQYHLTVHYDKINEKIVYDRKLKPGSGDTLYGIEVAKFLKLPDHVINSAMEIRNKYFDDNTDNTNAGKSSSYNTDYFVDKCGICGQPAGEVHHIKFQSETDTGFIDGVNKNHRANLVNLCQQHHQMVHHPSDQELIIFGYDASGKVDYTLRKPLSSFRVRNIPLI